MSHRPLAWSTIALLAVPLLLSCAKRQDNTGTARLAVSARLGQESISSITVTITGPQIANPITHDLVLTDGIWQGTITNVPIGADTFTAEAFEAGNSTPLFTGSEAATVKAGEATLVTIYLHETTTPPPFGGYAPVIESIRASPANPTAGQAVSLGVVATDQDATQTLHYAWTTNPNGAGVFDHAASATPTWTAPATAGPVALTITVSDARGNSIAATFTLQVGPDQGAVGITIGFSVPPVITSMSLSPLALSVGDSGAVAVAVQNDDGGKLTYAWAASDCAGTFSPADDQGNSTFTLTGTGSDSLCVLTVTVNDSNGSSTSGRLTLSEAAVPAPIFGPEITGGFASLATVHGDEVVAVTVGAIDPNTPMQRLSYSWSATVGALTTPADTATVTWTAPSCLPAAGAGLLVRVTNTSGLSTTQAFTLPPTAGAICDGQACTDDGDCQSQLCNHVTGLCVASACADGRQDPGEGGVDCGGTCAALTTPQLCATGATCGISSDCLTGVCSGGVCGQGGAGATCGGAADCLSASCGSNQQCDQSQLGGPCSGPSDCAAGACASGVCVPLDPEPLLSGHFFQNLAYQAGQLYWSEYVGNGVTGHAQVASVNVDGSLPGVLATSPTQDQIGDLLVDGADLYVTDFQSGNQVQTSVLRAPSSGGGFSTLASGLYISSGQLTSDPSFVWVAEAGSNQSGTGDRIRRFGRAGGASVVAGPGLGGPFGLAQAGGTLFFSTTQGVYQMPGGGGAPSLVLGYSSMLALRLTAMNGRLLVPAPNNNPSATNGGSLFVVDLGTLAVTAFANQARPQTAVTDGARVWWIDTGTYTITPPPPHCFPPFDPECQGGTVYNNDGSLRVAAVDGSGEAILVTGLHGPNGLAMDGSWIYYTTQGDGVLWRFPR